MKPLKAKELRKLIIQLSMIVNTGMDYFMSIPVIELVEIIQEVSDIGSQRERI